MFPFPHDIKQYNYSGRMFPSPLYIKQHNYSGRMFPFPHDIKQHNYSGRMFPFPHDINQHNYSGRMFPSPLLDSKQHNYSGRMLCRHTSRVTEGHVISCSGRHYVPALLLRATSGNTPSTMTSTWMVLSYPTTLQVR